MHTIEIDFDVFKKLTLRRFTEDISYNDVLRGLLGLDPKKNPVKSTDAAAGHGDWVPKGVHFPSGTEFRATYKGQTYYGKVESEGLVVDSKHFNSPSGAAVTITGNPVNGWTFWECRMPGKNSWQMIKSLRK